MTPAIHSLATVPARLSAISSLPISLQDKSADVFTQLKETLASQTKDHTPVRQAFNLRALVDSPSEIIEGALWGGFWGISAYFAANSFYELYKTFTVEHPLQEKFEKIGSVVKAAFVDLLSLASSTAYMARWADAAEVISLGRYVPLVNNLCYGLSLVSNGVEVGADVYNIYLEKQAILDEKTPVQREKHKQRLCHALMKLISNVSMIAWAVLGLACLAGIAASTVMMGLLLTVGCVVGIAAMFYKMHIDQAAGSSAITLAPAA